VATTGLLKGVCLGVVLVQMLALGKVKGLGALKAQLKEMEKARLWAKVLALETVVGMEEWREWLKGTELDPLLEPPKEETWEVEWG
jgi:hypothetical protein